MQNTLGILVFSCGLVACGAVENNRYRDTAALERPPTLALQKIAQNTIIDDSVEPKNKIAGLDEKVVLLDESPTRLVLKQSVSESWRTVGAALRQSDIKITDTEKNKYSYYVSYQSHGVLKNILSALNEENTKTIYVITLIAQEGDTLIQASLANRNEQRSQNTEKNVTNNVTDDSDGLIESLYHLLRDDVKTE
ncbi:MAG: hypothetical protein PHN45_05060 [Methylococcales bacterium]|nr:hypothetical protein [Methylococcales bacterium]MDD5754105.1 hypothetical protein [Methylococcales bacterium]